MPYSFSLWRPSSLIQSVVQAAMAVRTLDWENPALQRQLDYLWIMDDSGNPE
jgi:hypothetical protein